MSEAIRVEHLAYTYPGVEDTPGVAVFEDLDLTIEEGTFVAVLGTNGCGKSTLAKHFNSILLPCGGKVSVFGTDTADEEKLLAIRKTVGMVFQNPDNQLVATIVEDDVAFAPENLGVEPKEIRKRVDKALETVGLSAYAEHDTHKLSGGQKQRVAIAGMLAMNPECIIFDESTAMLDPKGREDIMNTILSLRDKGITVLLITHYMNEAALADHVVMVDHGKVILEGTPEYVFEQHDLLTECGLEAPQANMLVKMLKDNGIDIDTAGILDPKKAADAIFNALNKKKGV